MGRERGSSEERLGGWERGTEGLSCSEPSAQALVVAPGRAMLEVLHPQASAPFVSKSLLFTSPVCFWIKRWEKDSAVLKVEGVHKALPCFFQKVVSRSPLGVNFKIGIGICISL